MQGVKVTIIRYNSDEPQPGIVECQLEDAHGRRWSFVDKTAIVISAEPLNAQTIYPQAGVLAGEVVGRGLDGGGRELVRISTERPWYVESVEGVTQFDVLPGLFVEW